MNLNNSILYAIGILLFLLFSCSLNSKKIDIDESLPLSYPKDSVDEDGTKYKLFGKDSLYAFDNNDMMIYREFFTDNSPIQKVFYEKNGSFDEIIYNPQHAKDSMISEEYYLFNNHVQRRVLAKDTTIFTVENPIPCHKLVIEYHENGKIKEIGYIGDFEGQIVPIGLHRIYKFDGTLIKTKNYEYPLLENNRIIERPYVIESDYYNNQQPKWEKKFSNYAFYESGTLDEDKEPIGTWKYYNKNGTLNRIEKY